MNLSTQIKLFSIVSMLALGGCATHDKEKSYSHHLTVAKSYSTESEFITTVADLTATSLTRLHPEYVYTTLENRSSDPKIDLAFQDAFKSRNDEAVSKLVRALELKFILDPQTSVLDLLGPELSEHFRTFDWQFGDYPGGPDGPNEAFADVMVDALDLIRPERRANRTRDAVILKSEATEDIWQYMTDQWTPVPGQEEWMLNRHAVESFVKMREQARLEGVELVILSGHRSRSTAEANAARAGNAAAVASFSSHSQGLAVDFKMSTDDLQFSEITTRPMADVVRMRESPVHKWLFLRGDEFGWFPYQNEPWHWEYNPVGFRETFFTDFPGGAPAR